MREEIKSEHGSFRKDSYGMWHYEAHGGLMVFDAIEDAVYCYKTDLWDKHPDCVAWFWFNGVPCPMFQAIRNSTYGCADLWNAWQEWERAWKFDKAPNIKDILDVVRGR